MGIFISHASVDKDLVDEFVDMLQTGLNVDQKEIFCSSLEGLGIDRGASFVPFIKEKLDKAKIVIAIITPSYWDSYFCLCELGATWMAKEDSIFPILVPPLEYDDLKAVVTPAQSGFINDKAMLNDLRDRLIHEKLEKDSKTSRWEVKRDQFLEFFKDYTVKEPNKVPKEDLEKEQEKYQVALADLKTLKSELSLLEKQIDELKECKDKEEVEDISRKYTTEWEAFEALTDTARRALGELPYPVTEAIYYDFCGRYWCPERNLDNKYLWERIDSAIDEHYLTLDDNECVLVREHPRIEKAQAGVDSVLSFVLKLDNENFVEQFESQYEFPLDLKNKEFWSTFLGL